MPYIPQRDRSSFEEMFDHLHTVIKYNGISNGDLNYLITTLGVMYLEKHGSSYNTISDVVKALECAKLEFYRRVAVPYEDKKLQENGDVYDGTTV